MGHESELGESQESCHAEDVGHLCSGRNQIQHRLADGGRAHELSELNYKTARRSRGRTTGRFCWNGSAAKSGSRGSPLAAVSSSCCRSWFVWEEELKESAGRTGK